MFLLIAILTIVVCILSIYTVYKVLEIEKDIDTLYDSYAKEMEKLTQINMKRSTKVC